VIEGLAVLVLAGGGGTRLWPLSRAARPKPFLPLAEGVSPLRRAVALARRLAPLRAVRLVAAPRLARAARRHVGAARSVGCVVEPSPRNTAAALALGTAYCRRRLGAEWVLCLPADQWVRRPGRLEACVRRVVRSGLRGWLVTFGIRAARAHTGYGYIRAGRRLGGPLRAALRFVEKPSARRAAAMVRSGRWVWNSGMFLWRCADFLAEAARLLPRHAAAAEGIVDGGPSVRRRALRLWRSLPAISVDHGVLERARRVAVARCDMGWVDLGSWEELAASLPRAADGSRYEGRYLSVGGRDCFVYAPGTLTVNLGVRGVGLVLTPDVALMFDRRQHQRVREVVVRLARSRALSRHV
jgi:mannose-1-phosphate guanylyltransferase